MGQFVCPWGLPMVNQPNRRAGITQTPRHVCCRWRRAMLVDYIKPEQTFITCPNQDVAFGLGHFALDREPVAHGIIQHGLRNR